MTGVGKTAVTECLVIHVQEVIQAGVSLKICAVMWAGIDSQIMLQAGSK